MNEGSEKFKLDVSDVVGVGKNALLVGGAAALAYVAQNLDAIDLGMAALAVPVISVVLDTAIKWMKNNTK